MYYKVILNNQIVDLLNEIIYIRYQLKNHVIVPSDISFGEAILSSDGKNLWRPTSFGNNSEYNMVDSIEEISEKEYLQLKALNGQTPEEIIDNYTMYLIEEGLL